MKRRHVYLTTAALVAGALLIAAGYWLGRTSPPKEDMARLARRTIYVVKEFSWRWRSNRVPVVLDEGRPGTPVLAFDDRVRANAHCQQLNLQKRATANAFGHLPEGTTGAALDQYTNMGEAAFLAFLRAEGLTPPAYPQDANYDDLAWAWADWWTEHRKEWDDRLVERLWNALDRVYFYEVVEVVLES